MVPQRGFPNSYEMHHVRKNAASYAEASTVRGEKKQYVLYSSRHLGVTYHREHGSQSAVADSELTPPICKRALNPYSLEASMLTSRGATGENGQERSGGGEFR